MANPPGYIPETGQGLQAKAVQEGTDGGKLWLKHLKLHKYWPMFSHWSYTEFMSLNENNIGQKMVQINASGLTTGAKGKLLRSIAKLREREDDLLSIQTAIKTKKLELNDILQYLQDVVYTPLPTGSQATISETIIATIKQEARNGSIIINNENLQVLKIKQTMQEENMRLSTTVYLYISNQICPKWICDKMDVILCLIAKRPILHNLMEKQYPMKPFQLPVITGNSQTGYFRERRPTEDSGYSEEATSPFKKVFKELPVKVIGKKYIQNAKTNENVHYQKDSSSFSRVTNYFNDKKTPRNLCFRNDTNNDIFQGHLRYKCQLNSYPKLIKPNFSKNFFHPKNNFLPTIRAILPHPTTMNQNFYCPSQERRNAHGPSKIYSEIVTVPERNFAKKIHKLSFESRPTYSSSGIHNNYKRKPFLPKVNDSLTLLKPEWNSPFSYSLPDVGGKLFEKPSFETLSNWHQELCLKQYQDNYPSNLLNDSEALERQHYDYHHKKNTPQNSFNVHQERHNKNIARSSFKVSNLSRGHFGLLCGTSQSYDSYENIHNVPFYSQAPRPLSPNSKFLNATSNLAIEIVESVLKTGN